MKNKNLIIVIISLIFSIISGIITHDILIGSMLLFTSLICAYFASVGKKITYIASFINCLLMGYVAFKNNLYGIFIFYTFIFSLLQLKGFISWKENEDEDNNVKAREFTLKNGIIITLSCVIGSFLLGYILTLIPGQKLAYMDATSNCINLCGVILGILRFKEAWWVWLFNNVIDLSIWIIMVINHGSNSIMMLLSSLAYLIINIYGIIKWNKLVKKEK